MTKKQKAILFIAGAVLGVVIGAAICCGVYFATVGDIAWSDFIEAKLVPALAAVAGSVLSVFVAAKPIVSLVTKAATKFSDATDKVNETVKNNDKNVEKISGIEDRLQNIETTVSNIEKMNRIAFCNNKELVANGYAKKIAKIGTTDGHSETQN